MQRTFRKGRNLLKLGKLGKQAHVARPFSLLAFKSISYNPWSPVAIFRSSMFNKMNRNFAAETKEPEINLFPDIKSAYLKLAKKLHPDVSKDPDAKQKFPLLSEAYKILSNPKQRKIYDEVIGISDPTWSEDAKFDPEFENNEEFMNYVRGDRNYDDERKNINLDFEEKNAEDLYDFFRAKHLGGYGMRQDSEEESEIFGGRKFSGSASPLRGMNGLDMDDTLVDSSSKMAFHMKIDKDYRETKRKRIEDNDYILFSQNRHDAYYAKREEHEEHKNVGVSLLKEFKYFGIALVAMIAFVYTQVSPSGKGKLNGIKDSKKLTQKHLDKGLGVKNKIIPI